MRPMIVAVILKPSRSASGSIDHAMAGIISKLPSRLMELDQPIAIARRLSNQLLSIVIRGSQLPRPWPSAIIK